MYFEPSISYRIHLQDASVMSNKIVKISLDGQIFCTQKYGGISSYFLNMAKFLPVYDCEITINAPFHQNEELFNSDFQKTSNIYINMTQPPLTLLRLARLSTRWPNFTKSDIHHESYYSYHRYSPKGRPVVVTIHDMIPELFNQSPENDKTVQRKRASIERADAIICVSKNTFEDLHSFYPWAAKKSMVIYHGCNMPITDNQPHYKVKNPYFLYVGGRSSYKNFDILLNEFSKSYHLSKTFRLICVGTPFSQNEQKLIVELGLDQSVFSIQADGKQLQRLYEGATALVYPSSYEGFGLPPLEAMALGCPVICCDVSSLPEVCGAAAFYVSPGDNGAICAQMELLANLNAEQRQTVSEIGKLQSQKFTWDRCAKITADLYRSLVI